MTQLLGQLPGKLNKFTCEKTYIDPVFNLRNLLINYQLQQLKSIILSITWDFKRSLEILALAIKEIFHRFRCLCDSNRHAAPEAVNFDIN